MTELTYPRGRYFEEFEIGDEVETSTRTITETDVMVFAALSGDHNPLHTDAEFAKGTLFGERIAHGLLGLAVASGLTAQLGFVEGTAEAFIGLEWKFRAPIKFSDTVHLQARVKQKKAMPRLGGGFITFDVKLLNQQDETVQKGTWTVLIKSAP